MMASIASGMIITSENLIKDLNFKQKVGLKADLIDEVFAIVEEAVRKANEVGDSTNVSGNLLTIGPFGNGFGVSDPCSCDNDDIQINLKLFLASDDVDVAIDALSHIIDKFTLTQIDSLILAVPLRSVSQIGIGPTKASDEDKEGADKATDLTEGQKEAMSGLIRLYSALAETFIREGGNVANMGLCDLDTNVFKRIYDEVVIKPTSIQVNLKSCCSVPPDLQNFAKTNGIKLNTHSDPMNVMEKDFGGKLSPLKSSVLSSPSSLKPVWLMKMQSFIKSRGVLQDKRYVLELN